MITLQFYKNQYSYPDYGSITAVGSPLTVTPINIDSTRGTILTQQPFDDIHAVNYLSLDFGSTVLYAFITNVKHHSGDKRYQIEYQVDAFRSYINQASLGTQFIKRSPTVSNTIDPYLRGDVDNLKDINIQKLTFSGGNNRTLVVQVSVPSDTPAGAYLGHPLQPSPYLMHCVDYSANSWHTVEAITSLISIISQSEKPINLVSIYSIPYYAKTIKTTAPLRLEFSPTDIRSIEGFYTMPVNAFGSELPFREMTIQKPDAILRRTPHTVQIVVPEAGILNIPDDVLFDSRTLVLRQDIDITTGASNYGLFFKTGSTYLMLPHSVRGASVSGVPVAFSPEQQLMAINQTNRTTSLLSDVAGIAMGGAVIAGSVLAAPATGGVSLAGLTAGGVQAGSSLINLFTRDEALRDSLNNHSNPPAYLGSALLPSFVSDVFIVITKVKNDNQTLVNERFGYPQNKLDTLTLPASGFIQTSECCVSGANVPDWAKQEINLRFDNGIRFK